MTLVAALRDAYRALGTGDLHGALAHLDACRGEAVPTPEFPEGPAEWHRVRAMVHVASGDYPAAEQAFHQAIRAAQRGSERAGYALTGLGALYGHLERRDEAIHAYFAARDAFRRQRVEGGLTAVAYNLAWSLLQVMRTDEAAAVAEQVLLATTRADGRTYQPLIHMARSHVASARGDLRLAHAGALWAVESAQDEQVAVRAQHRLAQTLHALGQQGDARQVYRAALMAGPARQNQPLRSMIALSLATLERDRVQLDALLPDVLPLDRVRGLAHLADLAWRARDEAEAGVLLQTALDIRLPYGLASEAALLEPLYRWGREHGLPLPTPSLTATRQVTVHLRGQPGLSVNGHRISALLGAPAAALTAFLAEEGPATTTRLATHVLGREAAGTVPRHLRRVSLLLGDQHAVLNQERGTDVVWRLSGDYSWNVDRHGTGLLVASLDSSWSQEQRGHDL